MTDSHCLVNYNFLNALEKETDPRFSFICMCLNMLKICQNCKETVHLLRLRHVQLAKQSAARLCSWLLFLHYVKLTLVRFGYERLHFQGQ